MPITHILNPYRFSNELELRPSETRLPPLDERGVEISWPTRAEEGGALILDLSKKDLDWNQLSFTLDVSIPEEELDRILPPGTDLSSDMAMIASVHCPATKLQESITLEFVDGRQWRGDVDIWRDDVRSTVSVSAQLVRKTSLLSPPESMADFATEVGQVVADGPPLVIAIDEGVRSLAGTLDIRWRNFRTEGDDWEREHYSDVFHLDLERSEPRLYLNASYDKFRAALHETKDTGRDAVIRHLGNTGIVMGVWMQLLVSAVSALEVDEDNSVREPAEAWKKEALVTLSTHIFKAQDHHENLRRLTEMKSSEQFDGLMVWIGSVAQSLAKTGSLISKAIKAAEDIREEEPNP